MTAGTQVRNQCQINWVFTVLALGGGVFTVGSPWHRECNSIDVELSLMLIRSQQPERACDAHGSLVTPNPPGSTTTGSIPSTVSDLRNAMIGPRLEYIIVQNPTAKLLTTRRTWCDFSED